MTKKMNQRIREKLIYIKRFFLKRKNLIIFIIVFNTYVVTKEFSQVNHNFQNQKTEIIQLKSKLDSNIELWLPIIIDSYTIGTDLNNKYHIGEKMKNEIEFRRMERQIFKMTDYEMEDLKLRLNINNFNGLGELPNDHRKDLYNFSLTPYFGD